MVMASNLNNLMIGSYIVLGNELSVSSSIDMPSKSLAGNTSATDKAEKGVKAKKLTVSLSIPFVKKAWLAALLVVAEARDDSGEAVIYPIVDPLAIALRIRQVVFSGTMSINEAQGLRQWDISFTLEEHKSPAETIEQRGDKRTAGNKKASSFAELNAAIEAKL